MTPQLSIRFSKNTEMSFPCDGSLIHSYCRMCQGTSTGATGKRNSDKPKKYWPPSDGGELTDTSGLVGFRKTLPCEGMSENASHIAKNSRRKGTLSNYESA